MTKNSTRDAILEASRELFFKHGFRRVSIEDICRKAGVVRKTYYDYFSNKGEIVRYVLDDYMNNVTQKYHSIMECEIPFPEKLHKIIDMKIDTIRNFSMEFMEDLLSPQSEELRGYFEQKAEQNKELVYKFYFDAQKQGDLRSDIPVEIIMAMQNHLMDLCKNDEFRSKFKDVSTMLKQVSELYLFGVINRK